eukprot:15440293-Alexandrium_andersonii.AAC.1
MGGTERRLGSARQMPQTATKQAAMPKITPPTGGAHRHGSDAITRPGLLGRCYVSNSKGQELPTHPINFG